MWPLLEKPAVHAGCVLYRGPIAPPVEQILGLASGDVTATRAEPPSDIPGHWAVRLTHATWGEAVVVSPRETSVPDADVIRWGTPGLTDDERARAGLAETALVARVASPERDVLKARKHLLRWLRLLMSLDGLVAVDLMSQRFWSQAMLDDELAHDAPLDIEALYTIHAIYEQTGTKRPVHWLHTHGLEALGAFDIDVLRPSPTLAQQPDAALRALAFAALEGEITPSTRGFALGQPGGTVDLVPVATFDSSAAVADVKLRDPEPPHVGNRAVVCEPRGLLGFLRRAPVPSRFLSTLDGTAVFNFSLGATQMMADRARATFDVFRSLVAEFAPMALQGMVKIGYPTASDPASSEHLWFEVHGFDGERVDASCMNRPFDVPSLKRGQRGWHAVSALTDWMVLSPQGPMTPRNLSPARRLRDQPPAA